MSRLDFVAIQEALASAPLTCRYHGTNYDQLGTESYSAAGLPRCDSCKQPWRIAQALEALDRIVREYEARPALTTQHAWTHWRAGVACPHRETEENARRIAASNRGGYVSVREVTEWRAESTGEPS